jgi:beta-lactamase superfamily II metal-dependent hydrolase
MNKNIFIISFLFFFCTFSAKAVHVQSKSIRDKLPPWSEGYLDIHHINTGCGNAAFIVMPDGTTMLIDAGANNPNNERHVKPRPNDLMRPGQWISKYIQTFLPDDKNNTVDYCLLTHFHKDHIGGVLKEESSKGYFLTGITDVAEDIHFSKIVDRDFPNYTFQRPAPSEKFFYNYINFIKYQEKMNPDIMSKFDVGNDKQFSLKYSPLKYSNFIIQNVYANGLLWDGENNHGIINLFPDNNEDRPGENALSCVIVLKYGDFKYYTGGDVSGYPKPGNPQWHDIETPMSKIIGPVDICVLNHHGYNDATNDTFIKTLSPRVFIIQASDALHPNHSTLYRMLSKRLYKQDRDIFATNLHPAAKIVIGTIADNMKSHQGHILVRVSPGGKEYMIYILDDSDTKYFFTKSFGPYKCNLTN